MHPNDREEIRGRYRQRLLEGGPDAALATGTPERQRIRFTALEGVGDLHGARLLDLGCGTGSFFDHLRERDVEVDYTGYDISPELIEVARARHPDARFHVCDVQRDGIGGSFDYIVASQVFNNRLVHESNMSVVRDVLRICHVAAIRGVAIDFMSTHVDYEEDRLCYYSPAELAAFAATLTNQFVVRHDYPLFEFMLYLYPRHKGWHAG